MLPLIEQAMREALEAAKAQGLYRAPQTVDSREGGRVILDGRVYVNFASNDYLGLAAHPRLKRAAAAAAEKWGAGSGASRLLGGSLGIHADLEEKLAAFKHEEAAAVFSSGYLANLGAVTALAGPEDVVLVDRLNHASLIDAARLSHAKLWVFAHRDLGDLENLLSRADGFRRRLVLTDAYFSMDGDVTPLGDMLELCRAHDALLYVDEAHSTGVFGKNGGGMTEHFGLSGQIDVVMGTLSKALGSVGGFIAGGALLKEFLVNRSREFIYTTAPAPAASAAAAEALDVISAEPVRRERLWENSRHLREKLTEAGFDLMDSEGPIIPVLIGDTAEASALSGRLKEEGFWVPAIRPPTVPKGTDRLRISVSADHERQSLDRLANLFIQTRKQSA